MFFVQVVPWQIAACNTGIFCKKKCSFVVSLQEMYYQFIFIA
jgi:hypothetical protein